MPESNATVQSTPAVQMPQPETPSVLDKILDEHEEPDEDQAEEQEAPSDADDKQLNALLKKAESAFARGNKGLLLSRVECGKWCHAIYVFRLERNNRDRKFTSQLIFNRLAVHADGTRECDGSELAKMYEAVELLSPNGYAAWAKAIKAQDKPAMTIGKLLILSKLVTRVDGSELYGVFNASKLEQAKALFLWAHGDGLNKPSKEDVDTRVLELMDPKKAAEKQAEKDAKKDQPKAEDADAPEEDADDTPEPENLVSTEPDKTRPAPNWKDVPEGMTALLKEGIKQQPGHTADLVRDFAKEFVWTVPMVKGLIDGIASSKDAEAAQAAMQVIVDTIGDEYGIFPQSDLEEKEAA